VIAQGLLLPVPDLEYARNSRPVTVVSTLLVSNAEFSSTQL
jgi:hypothetical protein